MRPLAFKTHGELRMSVQSAFWIPESRIVIHGRRVRAASESKTITALLSD